MHQTLPPAARAQMVEDFQLYRHLLDGPLDGRCFGSIAVYDGARRKASAWSSDFSAATVASSNQGKHKVPNRSCTLLLASRISYQGRWR